jgi:hypothetical protein
MLRLLVIPQPAFYTIVTTRLRCSWDGDSIVLSRANSSRVFGIESFVLIIVAAAVFLPSYDGTGHEEPWGQMQESQPAAF